MMAHEPVSGYATNDRIYKFNLGFSDENGDGENDEAINLFVDICRTGTTFDALLQLLKQLVLIVKTLISRINCFKLNELDHGENR